MYILTLGDAKTHVGSTQTQPGFVAVWLSNMPGPSGPMLGSPLSLSLFFFHTIFQQVLTQETGHSSLCCTVGPHYLSILHVTVCIYEPQEHHSFFFNFIYLFVFLGHTCSIWRFPDSGSNRSCSHWPIPQPQQLRDPNCICHLHHSSWQCWILNPLSKSRDQTLVLWILVGFITTEQWQELRNSIIHF